MAAAAEGPCWEVVGGGERGGILVRKGRELDSAQESSRLSTGALVRELELLGERLHYRRLSGSGPAEGWVSVRLTDKELLVRTDKASGAPTEGPPPPQQSVGRPAAGREAAAQAAAAAAAAAARPEPRVDLPVNVYEVLRAACPVFEHPHVEGKVLRLRARGERVMCCEITVNGWMRLKGEAGWLLSHMQGAVDGLADVVRLAKGAHDLAVTEYHAQGLCCFEVTSPSGVEVRAQPGQQSRVVAVLRQGEYAFAQRQTFDGWVRLHGSDGWLTVAAPKGKRAPVQPRSSGSVEGVCLWSLADAWGAARAARNWQLEGRDVEALKRLERLIGDMTTNRFNEYKLMGPPALVGDGLLTEKHLHQPDIWLRQCVFANLLDRMATQGPVYRELAPNFALSEHSPPLPLSEVDEYGDMGFWSSGCLPFVHEGQTFVMAPDGMVIDPKTKEPVGIWNPETGDIVPFAIVQDGENTYLMNEEGILIDPTTKEVVGRWNQETQEIEPLGGKTGEKGEWLKINEPTGVEDDDDAADPAMAKVNKYLERATKDALQGFWQMAAEGYGDALKACKQVRMMDMELECEILRGRAACWKEVEDYEALLADAEQILSLDDQDSAALAWRSLASGALAADGSAPASSAAAPAVADDRPAEVVTAGRRAPAAGVGTDVAALD